MSDKGSNITRPSTGEIIATSFELPQPNSGAPTTASESISPVGSNQGAAWWHSQFNLMLAVFALLVIAALLLIVLIPSVDDSQQQRLSEIASNLQTSQSQVSPWAVGQQTDARIQAQDILEELLDSKKELESRSVKEWANKPYLDSIALAEMGDEYYAQQEFKAALASYRQAADDMESIFALLPAVTAAKVSEGDAAIAQGKSSLARESYQSALILDKNSIEAMTGLDRAGKLDQVLSLVSEIEKLEDQFSVNRQLDELLNAEEKALEAIQIDADLAVAQRSLARVRAAITEQRFKMEMSQAYRALFAKRYGQAAASFAEALKYEPNSQTAALAQKQALAFNKTSSLSNLLSSARSYENSEQWASALSSYEAVLQRDSNQVGAKIGKIRSEARLGLDLKLRALLDDHMLFGQASHQAKARELVAQGVAISNRGPNLNQQIAAIESHLKNFEVVQRVLFKSDSLSQVLLSRQGAKPLKLGSFSSKRLALKPGRYVAQASRLGYKDVRKVIELLPNQKGVQEFEIHCVEPLLNSLSSVGLQTMPALALGAN